MGCRDTSFAEAENESSVMIFPVSDSAPFRRPYATESIQESQTLRIGYSHELNRKKSSTIKIWRVNPGTLIQIRHPHL